MQPFFEFRVVCPIDIFVKHSSAAGIIIIVIIICCDECILTAFQNHACLWDVTSKDYFNRNVKEVSYNKLPEDLKTAEIPGTLEPIKNFKFTVHLCE